MKKGSRLLIGAVISGVIVFFIIVLSNFLSSQIFKPKLEGTLTSIFEQPVKVKQLGVNIVFGRAKIKGVTIKNLSGFPSPYLLTADRIIIEGNFIPFWKKNLIILKQLVIYKPEINIDYMSRGKSNLSFLFLQKDSKDIPVEASYEEKLVKTSYKGVFIKKLLIKKAKINFSDYEKGNPYLTVAEEVDIGVTNFTHWLRAKGVETLFIIKGQLKGEPVTYFEVQGKLNYPLKREVSGTIELSIANLPLVHFSPYYAPVLHHLEVESGLASIYTRIKCDKNNLTGASKLVIKDYTLKPKDKGGTSLVRIGEALKGKSGKLELMLRLGGTVYKPTFVLSTDVSDLKMKEFFNRLPGLDLSGTVLEGARKAGSGVGKQIGDIFGTLFLRKKR